MTPRNVVYLVVALWFIPWVGFADPRGLWVDAQKAYREGDFETAEQSFADLRAQLTATGTLDRAAVDYNRGTTLYRLARYDEALEAFVQASRTADLEMQAKVWFNHGRTHLASAEAALREGLAAEADKHLAEAMVSYRRVLRLQPGDPDAKLNYEWAVRERMRLRGLVINFTQLLDSADRSIAARQYEQAYQALTAPDPNRDLVLDLQPDLKSVVEQRVKHTGEVLGLIDQVTEFLEQAPGEVQP